MSELMSKLNEEKVVRIAMEMNPATKPYWSTCAPLLDLGTLCPAALTPRGWLAYMGLRPGEMEGRSCIVQPQDPDYQGLQDDPTRTAPDESSYEQEDHVGEGKQGVFFAFQSAALAIAAFPAGQKYDVETPKGEKGNAYPNVDWMLVAPRGGRGRLQFSSLRRFGDTPIRRRLRCRVTHRPDISRIPLVL